MLLSSLRGASTLSEMVAGLEKDSTLKRKNLQFRSYYDRHLFRIDMMRNSRSSFNLSFVSMIG